MTVARYSEKKLLYHGQRQIQQNNSIQFNKTKILFSVLAKKIQSAFILDNMAVLTLKIINNK